MCGVGKFMKRWKQWETDLCPRCGELEDASHVWVCKDLVARDTWSNAIANIDLTLQKLDTDPTIRHLILVYLNGWQTGTDITYKPPGELEAVLREQTTIG
jgi:hypothetical protein